MVGTSATLARRRRQPATSARKAFTVRAILGMGISRPAKTAERTSRLQPTPTQVAARR
jgi:hypothetical protein